MSRALLILWLFSLHFPRHRQVFSFFYNYLVYGDITSLKHSCLSIKVQWQISDLQVQYILSMEDFSFVRVSDSFSFLSLLPIIELCLLSKAFINKLNTYVHIKHMSALAQQKYNTRLLCDFIFSSNYGKKRKKKQMTK